MAEHKVIGLTGQTGAGKSTVSAIWESQGVAIVDADQVAHDVVDQEMQCVADLALAFSIEILNSDGTLDRRKLGNIVFGDKNRVRKLNSIIFPYILADLQARLDALIEQGERLILLDAPTLFESGADRFCDRVVSVVAPLDQRLNRIILRDHLTEEEARARIASQHADSYYASRSQYVIENDGDEMELRQRALEVLAALRQERDLPEEESAGPQEPGGTENAADGEGMQ